MCLGVEHLKGIGWVEQLARIVIVGNDAADVEDVCAILLAAAGVPATKEEVLTSKAE
jgi:hypothetical protein